MPSTPKLCDIWEYTLTEMLGHDSQNDTGRSLRFWAKNHKLEGFYHLLLWDVDNFTDNGALSSHMEKTESEEAFHAIHTPQTVRKFMHFISFPAPGDMELDHDTIPHHWPIGPNTQTPLI